MDEYNKLWGKIIPILIIILFLLFAIFSRVGSAYEVPVLCYHHFEDEESENPDVMKIDQFEEQMSYLVDNDYQTLSLDEFMKYHKQDDFPENSILLTFDDGYESFYTKVYPILKKYDLQAVVFPIVSSMPGLQRRKIWTERLTFHQMRYMQQESGLVEVGSHTYDLHYYRDDEQQAVKRKEGESEEDYICRLRKDLSTSRKLLEFQTDQKVNALAWPYGVRTATAEEVALEAGYELLFTIVPEKFSPDHSLEAIPRFVITEDMNMEEFINILN